MNAPHITWSWQFNFGNLVTATGLLIAGVIGWSNITHSDAAQTRRLDVLETAAAAYAGRLAAIDVAQARSDARFERIEELMTEVREELRALNRKDEK